MNAKTQVINEIIDHAEGGFVDDSLDSGGATNWGITERVARENNYYGDMRTMPRQAAFDIYSAIYWDAVRANDVGLLSPSVARELVDTGINLGPHKAATILQRCLNSLNANGQLYADLKVDGSVGPVTLEALQAYVRIRDEHTLVVAMNCLQGAFYIMLTERRPKDERFVYGWLKKRVNLT